MHLKISSGKWRPFCPGGDELKQFPSSSVIPSPLSPTHANLLPAMLCYDGTQGCHQAVNRAHQYTIEDQTRCQGFNMTHHSVYIFFKVCPWLSFISSLYLKQRYLHLKSWAIDMCNRKTTYHRSLKNRMHDDVIKWKHFPRYWPFVRGIHRSPVNSPHKGQWRGALMFTLICARLNGWVNNR